MTSTILCKYIIEYGHDIEIVSNILDIYCDIEIDTSTLIRLIDKSHMHYRTCNNIYEILSRDIILNVDPEAIIALAKYCGHNPLFNMYKISHLKTSKCIINAIDFLENMSIGKYLECRWMLNEIKGLKDEFCFEAILNKKDLFKRDIKYMNVLRMLYENYKVKGMSCKDCLIMILNTNMPSLMEHALWFANKM